MPIAKIAAFLDMVSEREKSFVEASLFLACIEGVNRGEMGERAGI